MKHITIGNTQLKNVEDMLCEIDDYEYPGEEVEIDDNSIILIYPYIIQIQDLNIEVREGTFYYIDDDGEYMPDFSLCLIYELDEVDPANWLYWEQDGIIVTLYNYLAAIGKANIDIPEYKCAIIV